MKYVIVGGEQVRAIHKGIYCKFIDLHDGIDWRICSWGELKNATLFDTREEAEALINKYPSWVKCCNSQVAQIHPSNISCT